MKLRRLAAVLMTAALTAGTLAGCGGREEAAGNGTTRQNAAESAEASEVNGDKINLKYYIWTDGENYTKEIAESFNSSQDRIQVEVISMPNETYDDKLKVMLSAGSDADLVNIRSLSLLTQFQQAEALLDITDRVKEGNIDVSKYGSMWDACYPDGKVSGLPMRSSCWMLFYNVDLLKEAGLTMPEQLTWEEYADMAVQLTSGDGMRYGGCFVDWKIYQAIATQMGTYLNDDDISNEKTGLEILNRLFNEDKSHVPLAEVKANDSQYLSDFENGRVAMLPQGEWLFNMLMTDTEAGKTTVNWDVAPIPVPEGVEAGTTWGATQFTAIPKDSKHAAEAYEFLEYLCGDGGAEVLPRYGILPAYSSDAGEDSFHEVVGKENATKTVFNAKRLPEAPAYEKYNDLVEAFTEHAELYLYGEKDIDETMANFEKQRAQIMSQ